jgi:hypothetical protein
MESNNALKDSARGVGRAGVNVESPEMITFFVSL